MQFALTAILLLTSLTALMRVSFGSVRDASYLLEMRRIVEPPQEPLETATPTSSPIPTPDPELEKAVRETKLAEAKKAKAQADKEAAEARKAEAEADKAAVEAKLAADKARWGIGVTTPSATPPSGNITGDKDKFIETQLLSEMCARKASHQMVASICASKSPALTTHPIRVLVINSSADKAAVENYNAILAQLNFLHAHYGKLIDQAEQVQKLPEKSPELVMESAAPLLIPAATEAVKSTADLINMFRTETEFKDQAVSVDTRMIVTFLTNTLLTTKAGPCTVNEIYYPSIYSLGIAANAANGPLIQIYRSLLGDISNADQIVSANKAMVVELGKKVEALDTTIADLETDISKHKMKPQQQTNKKSKAKEPPPPPFDLAAATNKLSKAEADKDVIKFKIDRLKQTASNLESFKASLADLLKVLTAVDPANSTPLLAGLLRAERLKDILKANDAYALDLVVKASGTNRIRKNAFLNAKIAHSGGVSIGANLFNNLDQLVFGQLEEYYIDFTNSGEIRKRAGFQKLDSSFAK